MKVISISQKKKINEFNIQFKCWGIFSIENKRIFLIRGKSKDIKIYRSDNYECIQTIKNAHHDYILGFIQLNNGNIVSYGWDTIFKIWSLN